MKAAGISSNENHPCNSSAIVLGRTMLLVPKKEIYEIAH